jgi:type IV pilus assembly protein PilP
MTLRPSVLLAFAVAVTLLGCEDEKVIRASSSPSAAGASAVDRKAMAAASTASAAPAPSALPPVDFQEAEFGESERSRDPFRSYELAFVEESRSTAKSQRQVVLGDFGIDELKLIGIVSGVPDAKAMLVDPHGKGHVVQRGQFVGRAEIVHGDSKGAPAYEVNWRIDRIREGDVVLVREDPKNPEVPSATRMLPLHPNPIVNIETLGFH